MNQDNKVIALFDDHAKADGAVRALQKAGFDMTKLSVVGRDYETEEQILGYVSSGDRVRYWGRFGALWGGLWGVLFGSAMLLIPGVGHLILLGPIASALLNLAGGAVTGGVMGALAGALSSIGIPADAVLKTTTAVHAGQFAVIAHGSPDDVAVARKLLHAAVPTSLDEHEPSAQPA